MADLNEDGHVVCPCGHGSNWHAVLGCDWCECPKDMDAAIEAAGVVDAIIALVTEEAPRGD